MTTLDQSAPIVALTTPAPDTGTARDHYPTDRDVQRFAHIGKLLDRTVGTGSRPQYDSVVIAGAGFTASVMAARLARSDEFRGKVVLAGPRTAETRQLKDVATLLVHGNDYI